MQTNVAPSLGHAEYQASRVAAGAIPALSRGAEPPTKSNSLRPPGGGASCESERSPWGCGQGIISSWAQGTGMALMVVWTWFLLIPKEHERDAVFRSAQQHF